MENFTMVVTPDIPTSEVLVDELRSIGAKVIAATSRNDCARRVKKKNNVLVV